jgi:hypothetical protein
MVALTITLVYLGLLAFGTSSTRYFKAADLALLSIHLAYMALISVLLVSRRASVQSNKAESLLRRWQRWTSHDHAGFRPI